MKVQKVLDFQCKVAPNRKKEREKSWGRLKSLKTNVSRSVTF